MYGALSQISQKYVVTPDTRTDLRPIDGSKRTYHCLVFPANYRDIQAQLTVDQ